MGAVLSCVFSSAAITDCRFGSFLLKGCSLKGKDLSFSKPRDNFWLWENWFIVESNATINMTSCAVDMFASFWKLEKGDLVWLQFTINLWKGVGNSSPFLSSGTLLVQTTAILLFCSFSYTYTVLINQWEAQHEVMLEINNLNPVILNRELMETEVLLSPWSEKYVIWTVSKGRLWAAVCLIFLWGLSGFRRLKLKQEVV